MNILITGVAGLLGSRLSDWILENIEGAKVVGVDNLSGGYIDNIDARVVFVNMDCTDTALNNVFEEHNIKLVFHFAAYAAEGLSPFIRTYNYNNNLVATANVVNCCIRNKVKRLVFTSTLAVYGHGYGGIFDEVQTPKPIDPYGVAKFACEMDIQIAGEQHGLEWSIVRPHNVYGIKQNIWDKYRNVLGIWMLQYMNNEPMTIFGDGLQTRAFSYIDDSLEPLWKCAVLPAAAGEIINLGGIQESTVTEAFNILREVIGAGEVVYKEARHEVKHSIPSFQKSIDLLGFKHKTDLKEGLTMMWDWAQKQPKRERFVWPSYELDNGIYSFWK